MELVGDRTGQYYSTGVCVFGAIRFNGKVVADGSCINIPIITNISKEANRN